MTDETPTIETTGADAADIPTCTTCGEPTRVALPPEARGFLDMDSVPRPCRCAREQAERWERLEAERLAIETRRHNLAAAQIPPAFAAADFDGLRLDDLAPDQRERLKEAITTCRQFVARPGSRSLILMGAVGAAKTHLAVAVLREAIERHGRTGLFWNWAQRWGEIRKYRSENRHTEAEDLLHRAQAVDLLVLDDVGVTTLEHGQLERVYEIVDGRYVNNRPWIVTTNANRRELESRLSERVVDRLFDAHRALIVTVTGRSWRR